MEVDVIHSRHVARWSVLMHMVCGQSEAVNQKPMVRGSSWYWYRVRTILEFHNNSSSNGRGFTWHTLSTLLETHKITDHYFLVNLLFHFFCSYYRLTEHVTGLLNKHATKTIYYVNIHYVCSVTCYCVASYTASIWTILSSRHAKCALCVLPK